MKIVWRSIKRIEDVISSLPGLDFFFSTRRQRSMRVMKVQAIAIGSP